MTLSLISLTFFRTLPLFLFQRWVAVSLTFFAMFLTIGWLLIVFPMCPNQLTLRRLRALPQACLVCMSVNIGAVSITVPSRSTSAMCVTSLLIVRTVSSYSFSTGMLATRLSDRMIEMAAKVLI